MSARDVPMYPYTLAATLLPGLATRSMTVCSQVTSVYVHTRRLLLLGITCVPFPAQLEVGASNKLFEALDQGDAQLAGDL